MTELKDVNREKQPPYKKIRVRQGKGYIEGYEVVCPECGHTARILSTGTKHYCLKCKICSSKICITKVCLRKVCFKK